MVCKIYQFDCIDGSSLYLNGSDSSKCNPEKILKLYLNWYNKEFAPFENLPKKTLEEFKFVCSFCPIDFYEESCEEIYE